jgi:hypothetical protein
MDKQKFDIYLLKGKLGKIRNWMHDRHLPAGLLFMLMGIISTAWFLIRVIPKPSRAGYPCMKVAAPFMSGFVVYLLSISGAALAFKRARKNLFRSRYLASGVFLIVALAFMLISIPNGVQNINAVPQSKTGPDDGPNQPFGKPQGVNPGRVVWAWNPDATNEKCVTGFDTQDWYWLPHNTNEKVVGTLFRDALLKLTGKSTITESWDLLFHSFNSSKSGKDKGYSKGEKIFIKINQGTARWVLSQEDKDKGYYFPSTLKPEDQGKKGNLGATETGPYIVLEIVRELVNELGIAQEDITIGDPMTHTYGHNYDIWFKEFPRIVYSDKFSDKHGRTLITPSDEGLLFYSNKSTPEKLYNVMEEADYLINLAHLKPHLSAGISLTAKNHFGSIASPTANHLHKYLIVTRGSKPDNEGYNKYRVFVDLMGSKYLGKNTLLYLVDALFAGGSSETKGPVKYFMPPFNNDWCNSIFLSQDQVAIESVCYDFLRAEWNGVNKHDASNNSNESNPNWYGVDDYLHQAADPANWPAGIIYDPDNSGKPLSSLGVHEHWNDPLHKQYSRNLGKSTGIELISIPENLVMKSN